MTPRRAWKALGLAAMLLLAPATRGQDNPQGTAAPPPADAPALSARKAYEQARSQLVQIRTVLKGSTNKSSTGSAFIVSPEGHMVTNFHVVSEAALHPDRYALVYVTPDGKQAPVELLVVDVLHDLALVRAAPRAVPFDSLSFRPASEPVSQGERMYSLGNPLDVGFAVIEGTYNGLVERSFYPQILFSGSLSAGMSGGPVLDQAGRVIGVNVARDADGEQVSFLVPAQFAAALLQRGRDAGPMALPAWPVVLDQLTTHQAVLTDRFIRHGWQPGTHPRYAVPVPANPFMRCRGRSIESRTGGLDVTRSLCDMASNVFVGEFTTGWMATAHDSYDGAKLGALRFSARYSKVFGKETFVRLAAEHQTKPQCREDFVDRSGLPLRVVVCMKAYKKLPTLYDASVLVATVDRSTSGVQGRLEVQGVTYANALRLTRHYLEAYGWAPSR